MIWDEGPVVCLTADVDWAAPAVLERFFEVVLPLGLPLTLFLTHPVDLPAGVDAGHHPNFLPGSSHGDSIADVVAYCRRELPSASVWRCHRWFDVDDAVAALLAAGYRYDSNLCTRMQPGLSPLRHRFGQWRLPVFWEDGMHLSHGWPLHVDELGADRFLVPGLKILDVHPIHVALNSGSQLAARCLKDSLPRDSYRSLSSRDVDRHRNGGPGIATLLAELAGAARAGATVMSLGDVHRLCDGVEPQAQ